MYLEVSEKHKVRHYSLILALAFFLSVCSAAFADSILRNLDRLELVIEQTIGRLESDIDLAPEPAGNFISKAVRQFELSALAADRPELLEEDYYHLALSLIAGHFGEYAAACQLLREEMKLQTFYAASEWMRKEANRLEKRIIATTQPPDYRNRIPDYNYKAILRDLKQTLIRAGVR